MTSSLSTMPRHLSAQLRWLSPLGEILIARTSIGLAGVWFAGQKDHPGHLDAPLDQDDPFLRTTADELAAYFDASTVTFTQPLDLHGTPFQRAVWQALLAIDAGQTSSYGAVARAVGSPNAVRAVGAAIGRNPVSVIVPCHRVIGSSGDLTGYAGGLDRKRALLRLEGVAAPKAAGSAQASAAHAAA